MRDGDDVASGIGFDEPVNCPGHPLDDSDEALADRRRFVGGREFLKNGRAGRTGRTAPQKASGFCVLPYGRGRTPRGQR
jgi:hypothetical protein